MFGARFNRMSFQGSLFPKTAPCKSLFRSALPQPKNLPSFSRMFHNYSASLFARMGSQTWNMVKKHSDNPLLSRPNFLSLTSSGHSGARNYGFVRLCTQGSRFSSSLRGPSLADAFLETKQLNDEHTVLQFTDLHYYNNGSRQDREGVQLIGTIAERVKPNLVVLTGDIIDGRYCNDYKCFGKVVQPLIEQNIPWTYVPGNHDDESKKFTRKDLLQVYKLPLCASRHSSSFTHSIKLGPLHIFLFDSNGYENPSAEVLSYDFIKPDQIDWYNREKSEGEVGLGFFHIPLQEYKQGKVLVGSRGEEPCVPRYNSGLFDAVKKKRDIHALFTGHDHWNDFVSELKGVWLAYGRVSGFTDSCFFGEGPTPVKKQRGGRVIRYASSSKLLSTWIENKSGVEQHTLVSKPIRIGKGAEVDDYQ